MGNCPYTFCPKVHHRGRKPYGRNESDDRWARRGPYSAEVPSKGNQKPTLSSR